MSRKRVILIEDHSDSRELMAILVGTWYDVQAYPDGPTGLKAIRESPPDIVLLDVGLPEMDGFAVLREIRSAPETQNLPVIAITGHVMPDDRENQLMAGFNGLISKPVLDTDELHTAIERALTSR